MDRSIRGQKPMEEYMLGGLILKAVILKREKRKDERHYDGIKILSNRKLLVSKRPDVSS